MEKLNSDHLPCSVEFCLWLMDLAVPSLHCIEGKRAETCKPAAYGPSQDPHVSPWGHSPLEVPWKLGAKPLSSQQSPLVIGNLRWTCYKFCNCQESCSSLFVLLNTSHKTSLLEMVQPQYLRVDLSNGSTVSDQHHSAANNKAAQGADMGQVLWKASPSLCPQHRSL